MTVTADRRLDAAEAALTRATRHLLALQQPEGWWKGELETNVTIDAEDLFLRHFLGLLDGKTAAATAGWIRGRQRPDGSWATYHGGPGDLSTSLEAYVALRLAGDPPDAGHMARAARVADEGGAGQSRVFTRMWLSLLGLWSWSEVPALPPEQILLPARAPLSVYSFGCWARQTIVALSVVTALRPAERVAFAIEELHGGGRSFSSTGPRTSTAGTPSACCGGTRSGRPSSGSSTGRSGTARGAGSSRPGCGRSSPCAGPASTPPARPGARSTGCSGCRAAQAASAPSTSTTRAGSRRSSPSATSAR